jgi:hypothetical protein
LFAAKPDILCHLLAFLAILLWASYDSACSVTVTPFMQETMPMS